MQHSSHARSLPHGQHEDPVVLHQPSTASTPPVGAPSSSQVSPKQSPNPHGRRLQIRNARFTASPIPSRRVSPILGLVAGPIEPFSRIQDSETSPPRIRKRSLYGESLPSSPVNILQEIQNSARRKTTSPKAGIGRIFQNSPIMDENIRPLDDDEMSWYEENSYQCTPFAADTMSSIGVFREGSLNQKSQPQSSSPLAKQTRGRTRGLSGLSANAVEQSRYIEHLESQLASAQAKIDGLTSPKANKLRSVKLRSLTAENRNLVKDNSEWAKRAEEMVEEERKKYASLELEMKSLEEDQEIKDARIAEFEWELETMRAQIKEAEGLEEANASLEKKIDMLSGLLVHSPNKTRMTTSPKKLSTPVSPVKRRPRPASVLTRVASPNGTRMSLASASETAFWDSRSRSTSILESQEDCSPREIAIEQSQSPISDTDNMSQDSAKRFSFSDSYDDRRNSTSVTTFTGPSSRPTSFMSTSSMGVSSWGIPMQPDGDSKYSNRQRKMRKFPSGSNSLKPLILPVASSANNQSLPASAPIYSSIDSVACRDVSGGSLIDPTTAFLADLGDSNPYFTPRNPSRPRSATFAREEALRALEGRRQESSPAERFDGIDCIASGSSSGNETDLTGSHCRRRSDPQNLQKELEQASLEHRADRDVLATSAASRYQNLDDHQQRDTTPRARPETVETLSSSTPPAFDAHDTTLCNSPPDHPRSLFARITSLITQTKQDPIELARRILANAWTLGCVSLGGLGWWLIGPLHHQQRCRSSEGARHSACHEGAGCSCRSWPYNSHPWQHFSAEIRDGRLVDSGYASSCRGTWDGPHPQEPCPCHSKSPYSVPRWRSQSDLLTCNDCVEPSSRRTFRVWFQFSLTVVLAVGMALRYGPGFLLANLSEDGHTKTCPRLANEEVELDRENKYGDISHQDDGDDTVRLDSVLDNRSLVPSQLVNSNDEGRSAYGNVVFAEVLRPADFEAG